MQPKHDFNAKQVLRRIKEYKDADPNFEKAIKQVAEAEAKFGKDDPCEGKVVIQRVKPKSTRK